MFILGLIMFWVHEKFGNGLDDLDGSGRPDDSIGPRNPNRLGWVSLTI